MKMTITDTQKVALYVLNVAAKCCDNEDAATMIMFLENDVAALTEDELLESATAWYDGRNSNA